MCEQPSSKERLIYPSLSDRNIVLQDVIFTNILIGNNADGHGTSKQYFMSEYDGKKNLYKDSDEGVTGVGNENNS